jgi:uncharacterized membrane protein YhaH (DUF805 family)
MNFQAAVASCFSKYATFSGRAPRSEYWYFVLFCILASIVTAILDTALFRRAGFSPLSTIASLGLVLPSLAASVRRLHDTGRSGWWVLLLFVPLVGQIILIVWYCTRGEPGPNRFGPPPFIQGEPAPAVPPS